LLSNQLQKGAIRNVHKHLEGLQPNGDMQLLVYTDYVNLLGKT